MKVFITRKLPGQAVEMLVDKGFDVTVFSKDRQITKPELLRLAKDADALITLLSDKIDAEIIGALSKLKVIANYAVGYNNIDLEAARARGIIVTNTPDILTDATADIAMTLMLCCMRHVIAGDTMMRQDKFTGWAPELLLGMGLRGKTLGIIGAGRIGAATALRARAFGANIIYYSRSRNEMFEEQTGGRKVTLPALMKKSDIVSVHIPLTESTRMLLNKEMLALLKPTAVLINTARGEVLDEAELIRILGQKKIFAAGFDVYENEPDFNRKLLKLKNVVLLPHLGSATIEARENMAELCAKNVANVLKGKKPLSAV